MEWFILIIVLPLILIPIVLLGGFAGCGDLLGSGPDEDASTAPSPPAAPDNLTATVISTTQINLEWHDNSAGTAKFELERTLNAPGGAVSLESGLNATPPPHEDKGLQPGTSYTFRVFAVNLSTGLKSAPSNAVTVSTLPAPPPPPVGWQAAYDNALTTDDIDMRGDCLVQRFEPGALTLGGEQIRLTLRGTLTAGFAVDRLFISEIAATEPGNPTPDLWDSPASGLRELRPGGLYIPKGKAVTLEPIDYHLDTTKGLIVAFDINAGTGAGKTKKAAIAGQNAYRKAAIAEANIANRSSAYTALPGVYMIEKIEAFPTVSAPPAPLMWTTTYSKTLTTDGINLGNATVVQRISAAQLTNSGSKVRLTLRAATTTALVIRRIFISSAAAAGEPGNPTPNLWDSTSADIVEVHTAGASIPANTTVTLPPFDFALDETKDLIVAFDISEIGGGTTSRETNSPGQAYFYLANSEEATISNRSAGYATVADTVCFIEKIEVGV